MMQHNSVTDVRATFTRLLRDQRFTSINREKSMTAIVGSKTIETIGASFIADQDVLFGEMNWDYVSREASWYKSMSRNVNDFPGGPPTVWQAIAARDGTVNSNYGFCVWSAENGKQFDHVIAELKKNPESRRAVMIYTRPSMWEEYNVGGRSDFVCTNVVQYLVRDGGVSACVQMRSNDAVIGYKNDRAWQHDVLCDVANALGLPVGDIYWNAGSLHVYERHFYLVDHYMETGELSITKARYRELYPGSPYLQAKETPT
jgi:thymidylate synthase